MTIIITNCTNRKKGLVEKELNADSLDIDVIDIVAKQWMDRLSHAKVCNIAGQVYCGRSFREASDSAEYLKSPLYIVSAGLGVVNSESKIPLYNLTVSNGVTNSINSKIINKTNPNEWWQLIITENPFGKSLSDVIVDYSENLILIALSKPYISLIKDELANIPEQIQKNLRFFGKNLNLFLPDHLIENWMPYDDRLDSSGIGYSGTQTDFAQRALRHFVMEILDKKHLIDAKTHSNLVLNYLTPFTKREVPKRKQMNDQDIENIIRKNWILGKGQSSLLLRFIRSELGIACAQSRFQRIYHIVKNTIEINEK
jgi:hypothetical protein